MSEEGHTKNGGSDCGHKDDSPTQFLPLSPDFCIHNMARSVLMSLPSAPQPVVQALIEVGRLCMGMCMCM